MDGVLSIGALAHATGIPAMTLRAWESRYGFPAPARTGGGQRTYDLGHVERLRKITEALAAGMRPREVVPLPEHELDRLLFGVRPSVPTTAGASIVCAATSVRDLLELVVAFDGDRLMLVLGSDWARMDPVDFLEERVAPLVEGVGEAWARRELGVRHEHFLSERVGALLSTLRLRAEERAHGPTVVVATLPGERHTLGIQMASLALTVAGVRALYLGAEVPLDDVVALSADVRAVAVGVSRATRGAATNRALRRLRASLPTVVELVVGGAGAPEDVAGVMRIPRLRALHEWARVLHEVSGRRRPATSR